MSRPDDPVRTHPVARNLTHMIEREGATWDEIKSVAALQTWNAARETLAISLMRDWRSCLGPDDRHATPWTDLLESARDVWRNKAELIMEKPE